MESVGGDSRNVDKLKRREVKADLLSIQRNDPGVSGGLKQDETTWEKSRQCRVRGFLSLPCPQEGTRVQLCVSAVINLPLKLKLAS